MADTPQPATAGENAVTLDDGAAAFKALLNPQPAVTRDEGGRFASPNAEAEPEVEEEAEQAEAPDDGEDSGDADETDDAPDEGQQDDVEMPASWGKDDEEVWSELTPRAKAKVVERETQREQAVNAKFQESANARRLAEQQASEANANRDRYAQAINEVVQLVSYPEPDPTQYGLGTGEYDRESYDLAHYQWRQAQATIGSLVQQRQQIAAQQAQEAEQARRHRNTEVETVHFPKLVELVPELGDPAKAPQVVHEITKYAIDEGFDPGLFVGDAVLDRSSVEYKVLWKAKEYDRIKAAGQRVKAGNPPPKPASPPIKPGGVTPRQTIQANRLNQAKSRLAKSHSVDDAAAVFKNLGF